MNTNFQNQHRGGLQSDLEAAVEREHEKLKKEITIKAIHYAKQNRPGLQETSLQAYIGEFTARYEKIISQAISRLQPELAMEQAKALNEEAAEKIKIQEGKKEEAQIALDNLDLSLEQDGISLETLNNLSPKKSNDLIPYVIVAGEIIFNVGALQLLGDTWLSSLVISSAISLSLFLLAKQYAKYLKENSHDSQKKKRATLGVTLIALGVFFLLAILRSKQLEETDSFQLHPIFLIIVNILFFVITAWHFFKKSHTATEKKEYEKLKQLKEKREELQKAVKDAESEIERIKSETKGNLQELLERPVQCKWLIELIQRYKQEAIETFKSQNLLYRKDRSVPQCFRENIPSYFINS